jgi:hypothetical protein
MLTYTAPNGAPCIVEASDSPEYWQPLHDVDLLVFEGTNSDDQGREQRIILIGAPSTEVGRGNTPHSRALQPDTLYYFRLTCGQAVVTGTFRTIQLTNGTNYPDAPQPSRPSQGTPVVADSIAHRPPPVPSPRRPPWRPRRHLGHTCLSVASGNWNDASKWTACGGGVPGDGDTAKIDQGDTITIPAGYHATVGVSGAGGLQEQSSGLAAAIGCNGNTFHGANGNGILIVNGWLTYRGNVEQCTAVWQAGPDAILEHDSSLASVPGTTHYRWIIGSYLFPDAARLVIRGTVGHRATIRNAAGSGTFYGFAGYYGAAQGTGQFDFEYVTIAGCGNSASPCTNATNHSGTTAFIARCDHCLVISSGYMGAVVAGASNVAAFTNSTFTGSTDTNWRAIRAVAGGAGSLVIDTVYTDGQIGLGGSNDADLTGTHLRNIVIRTNTHTGSSNNYGLEMGGAHFQVAEFDRVLRITDISNSTGMYIYLPGGNITRLMGLVHSTSNPHCFHGPDGIAGATDTVDGGWIENIGGGTDGDALGSGTAGKTVVRNLIMPCPLDTGISMSMLNMQTDTPRTFAVYNNTYCGKDDGAGSARGFGFEIAGTANPGLLAAARNNIVFCATPSACYLVHQGPTGTDSVGTYANVDYNWRWNVATGPYFQMSGTPYTSYNPNPPGAHDSSGDPQFVQQRHFLDWGQMLKPSISTWTDIVAEFAKMNDDTGYDSRFTIENAYNWLRDGYRPQNAAVMNAGDTGGRVGAMDAVSQR